MKIVDSRKDKNTIKFARLKNGETFRQPNSNEIYMRMETICERSYYYDDWGYLYDSKSNEIVNAICLSNGKKRKFDNTDDVILVNCECVIKE